MLKTLTLGLLLTVPAAAEESLYRPEGRRDPFLRPTAADRDTPCPGRGLAALRIDQSALRGLVHTPRGATAMLLGQDGRSHLVAAGDRMCDGVVAAVTRAGVTFLQDVNDPMAPARTRTVTLVLHGESR
jgi:hypothetical protein